MERIKTIGEDLAALHAYLCADGCVTSHQEGGTHKYYRMQLKNMEFALLEDFASRFERVFGLRPKISKNSDLASVSNKEIYGELTSKFGSFYSYEWAFPKLFSAPKLKAIWLRAIYDCEGWVYCKKGEDRHVGLEMVNRKGVIAIKKLLREFGVYTGFVPKKKGKIFRLNIFGKENIERFSAKIGFLHPKKKEKLSLAIASFVDYNWKFPEVDAELKKFVLRKLAGKRHKFGKKRIRICSCVLANLKTMQIHLKQIFDIHSVVSGKQTNSRGDSYFELSINSRADIEKIKSIARN